MKYTLTILSVLIGFVSFSEIKEIELADYWQLISVKKDTTLNTGQSKIKLTVEDKNSNKPIKNTSIHLNKTQFIGQTDSIGQIIFMFNSGENRICADTEQGNSFNTTQTFLPQHEYVVKVKMNPYPTIEYFDDPNIYPVAEKPVIYLYPTKTQKINIKVKPKGEFTFTYPKYPTNGWSVLAHPNGQLQIDNKKYNYLFWEATMPNKEDIDMSKGFIVNSDTVVDFLEHTLAKVGLNDFEQTDFITYWAPRLQKNQLNLIHFDFNDDCDKLISEMQISPKPESLIRIFMSFKPYYNEIILPQQIPFYHRKGFTAVEWGGCELMPEKS